MKKLIFSFFVVSMFLLQSAFAADFSVSVDKSPEYMFYAARLDHIAVAVSNPGQADMFQLSVIGVPLEWLNIPLESSTLSIPVSGTSSVNIDVNPSKDALPGVYKYFLKVTRLSSRESYEQELLVNVVQTTSAIVKDASLSCTSCTDAVNVSGEVVNVGSKPLDLAVTVTCGNVQKTLEIGTVDVGKRSDMFTSMNVSSMTPGSYAVDISLVDSTGKMQYNESLPFTIPSVDNLVYDKSVTMTPFGSSVTVRAINLGNIVKAATLEAVSATNWYTIISSPRPTGTESDKYYWSVSVDPKQSVSISYAEIYWPTYIIIIAAILAFIFVYIQTSAFTFSKRLIGGSSIRAGKDVSISLHIKSKGKGIDKMAVRDIVPSDFAIVSKFETVKPLIRKVANGIELVWKLGGLRPNEERVLHYTIRPNDDVSGRVNLPAALAKAMNEKGLKMKYSNGVALSVLGSPGKAVSVRVAK